MEKKIYSSWNKTGNGSRISGKPMKEEICLNSTFAIKPLEKHIFFLFIFCPSLKENLETNKDT